ncbi:monocarboxylate transporter 13-like [Diadema antillarum]|uniref:monocarboxylate transporter 13-like n=1 Tax=Diadema antillarum TaxID=105358 RepID=UPI003A8A86DE
MMKGLLWLRDRWGWLVTVASFILYFITLGVLYCYGLLFISLQEEFKSSATLVGWIGSLAWAISTLTSPLTALLLRCCQTRAIAALGVVFCSSSLLISSVAPNVYTLFASFSIMYGMGINFAQHSTLCLIYTYFPNKNSTRTVSFALTGCQVGLLSLNPLMAYFVATIGWRPALRIFSAVVFVPGVISCIILLPPKKKTTVGNPETGKRLALYKDPGDTDSQMKGTDFSMHCKGHDSSEPKLNARGSQCGKFDFCECCHTDSGESETEDRGSEDKCLQDMTKSPVQERLSKHPDTYFFVAALATLSLSWTFFNVNLVSYTDSVGITANHGSIILTILAGGEMVGKALLSIFGDHIPFAKVYVIIVCNILSAAVSVGMIFARNFTSMISVAMTIGLLRAVFNTVPFGLSIELFGSSRTAEASTLTMFSYGSGYIIGSVIPGGIYDLTGSYTLSLVCMTGFFVLSAAMFLIIPFRKRLVEFIAKGCRPLGLGRQSKEAFGDRSDTHGQGYLPVSQVTQSTQNVRVDFL